MIHTHTVHPQDHADFLAQNRQDPITGEAIQADDRVVFCASCKSAFLEDSWEYLGGEHCGQQNTLANFPQEQSLTLAWRELDGKLGKTTQTWQMNGRNFLFSLLISAVSLGVLGGLFFPDFPIGAFSYPAMLGVSAILQKGKIRYIEVFKNGLRVHRFLSKKKDYRMSEIERISISQTKNGGIFGYTLKVTIKFKGKKAETFPFGSDNERSIAFFKVLRYLSAQTEIHFDLVKGGVLHNFIQRFRAEHQLDGRFLLKGDE
ncbi:MAG: hypothetical protein AAF740_05350, partial [Bacteroidota bacterium]